MFLALKEIRKEKMRYGMVIAMIALISYLIFILTALALGLANENTDAINSWDVESAVLAKDANVSFRQSLLTPDQVKDLQKDDNTSALLGQTAGTMEASGKEQDTVTFIGLDEDQFIAKGIKLSEGRRPEKDKEVIADSSLRDVNGYQLGDHFKLNSEENFTIVGFTDNAKLNIAPVLYGSLKDWQTLTHVGKAFAGNAVFSKKESVDPNNEDLASYPIDEIIDKLPGYSAQNMTFAFMIGFLMIISLIIIGVFLYIITLQKINNYAVLRAQGIPASVLIRATFSQSAVLAIAGVAISGLLVWLTALALPAAVPMAFDFVLMGSVSLGLIVMALLGSVIPMTIITRIDPVNAIGG